MARLAKQVVAATACTHVDRCTSPVEVFEQCVDGAMFARFAVDELKRPRITGVVCFFVGLLSWLRHGTKHIESVAQKFIESAG